MPQQVCVPFAVLSELSRLTLSNPHMAAVLEVFFLRQAAGVTHEGGVILGPDEIRTILGVSNFPVHGVLREARNKGYLDAIAKDVYVLGPRMDEQAIEGRFAKTFSRATSRSQADNPMMTDWKKRVQNYWTLLRSRLSSESSEALADIIRSQMRDRPSFKTNNYKDAFCNLKKKSHQCGLMAHLLSFDTEIVERAIRGSQGQNVAYLLSVLQRTPRISTGDLAIQPHLAEMALLEGRLHGQRSLVDAALEVLEVSAR